MASVSLQRQMLDGFLPAVLFFQRKEQLIFRLQKRAALNTSNFDLVWRRRAMREDPSVQMAILSGMPSILQTDDFIEYLFSGSQFEILQSFLRSRILLQRAPRLQMRSHTHIGSTNLPSRERNRRAHSASRHFSSNMKRRTCRHATFTRSFYKNGPMHAHMC